jgi:hypothetical protein
MPLFCSIAWHITITEMITASKHPKTAIKPRSSNQFCDGTGVNKPVGHRTASSGMSYGPTGILSSF